MLCATFSTRCICAMCFCSSFHANNYNCQNKNLCCWTEDNSICLDRSSAVFFLSTLYEDFLNTLSCCSITNLGFCSCFWLENIEFCLCHHHWLPKERYSDKVCVSPGCLGGRGVMWFGKDRGGVPGDYSWIDLSRWNIDQKWKRGIWNLPRLNLSHLCMLVGRDVHCGWWRGTLWFQTRDLYQSWFITSSIVCQSGWSRKSVRWKGRSLHRRQFWRLLSCCWKNDGGIKEI